VRANFSVLIFNPANGFAGRIIKEEKNEFRIGIKDYA